MYDCRRRLGDGIHKEQETLVDLFRQQMGVHDEASAGIWPPSDLHLAPIRPLFDPYLTRIGCGVDKRQPAGTAAAAARENQTQWWNPVYPPCLSTFAFSGHLICSSVAICSPRNVVGARVLTGARSRSPAQQGVVAGTVR